jgi:hypothetical protein
VRERPSEGWPADRTRVKVVKARNDPDNSLLRNEIRTVLRAGKIIMHSLYIFVHTKGTKDPEHDSVLRGH